MQLLRSWFCFCALIIMNHMYVVLLGSNLGKAKGQISLMQNLDQNIEPWHNFYFRRGKAKTYFFYNCLRRYKAELLGCG